MANNPNDMVDARPSGDGDRDETDARGQSRLPRMTKDDFESEKYNMKHRKRGVAVIINNKNFQHNTGKVLRSGSDTDANAMHRLLTTLGFQDIRQYNDKKASEIREILSEVSKIDHTDSDCVICVILTYGDEGYVFGTDDKIPVDELVGPFKGQVCPSLAGKPKLFFIQACKDGALDEAKPLDSSAESEDALDDVIRRIPTEADIFMAYSVIPGRFSWKSSTSISSWFIQAVYDVLSKNWKTMDILTMMTKVNRKVANDYEANAKSVFLENKKQIPYITSMLTKDLYFA